MRRGEGVWARKIPHEATALLPGDKRYTVRELPVLPEHTLRLLLLLLLLL